MWLVVGCGAVRCAARGRTEHTTVKLESRAHAEHKALLEGREMCECERCRRSNEETFLRLKKVGGRFLYALHQPYGESACVHTTRCTCAMYVLVHST